MSDTLREAEQAIWQNPPLFRSTMLSSEIETKQTEGTVVWNSPPKDLSIPPGIKVAWSMPIYGPVPSQVYQSHLAVAAYASRHLAVHDLGGMPFVGTTDKMYLHSASNLLVEQFLMSDCTHLFWTEMDMMMPFWTIPVLLAHDKPIISGVYFLRKGDGQSCLYMKGDVPVTTGIHSLVPVSIFPEDSVFKVHCPGMGCVLFKREVFEKIEPPWFDLKEGYDRVRKTKTGYGQDVFFYSKVANAGLDVWVDSSVHCIQQDIKYISIHDYRKKISSPDFVPNGAIIGFGEEQGKAAQ